MRTWDLRLIRERLREIKLDWPAPPLGEPLPNRGALEIRVIAGY